MAAVAIDAPVQFDRFTLDPADERLIGPQGPIRIGNKAYRVLGALIEHRGRLLTKEALFETVWDGAFVSESALTSVIKELRRALGDDPKHPVFIESVYGRGYRFVAPVSDGTVATARADEPDSPVADGFQERLPTLGSLVSSVAVLPFTELGEGVEDWLADSLVEEVVVALTRFHSLFVISAMTSLNFRDAKRDRGEICRTLNVRYLLEGSVRRSGARVRVTARLVDGIADQQIWADKFDDTIDDLFALHDRVALAVAGRIGSSIDDAETRRLSERPMQSADTMALYARANTALRKMRPETLREGCALSAQILELEPGNRWAAAMGAICHGLAINMGWRENTAESRGHVAAMVQMALDSLGDDERILSLCGAALICSGGDLAAGTRLIDRAVEINPGYASALLWGGWTDAIAGRADRGLERLERSLQLNPLSAIRPLLLFPLGSCLLLLRRFDEAAKVLGEAQALAPNAGVAAGLTAALAHAGRLDQARAAHAELTRLEGSWGGLSLLQNEADVALVREGIALAAA